jgi:hypothetical protein
MMSIPWYRTWPSTIPDGRNYVVDRLPKAYMKDNTSYEQVLTNLYESSVLVEWDIVIDPDIVRVFNFHIDSAPDTVHVAPYRLYPTSTKLEHTVWAHRAFKYGISYWIDAGEVRCDLFSFGLVYIPYEIVQSAPKEALRNDDVFSNWYHREYGLRTPVHWDVRPIHLHYENELSFPQL